MSINNKTNRFMELEGLRGLAALAVFIFHFLIIFYPVLFYGSLSSMAPVQHLGFEDDIHGTPFAAFVSGTFAVAIFFVLSGFVLSIGFFTTKKTSIIKKLATKRYLRLMLPAAASVIVAWALISLNLSYNSEAYSISQSGALYERWAFNPDIFKAVYEGVVGVFVSGPAPDHNYNSVLWTMKYEFIGSFIVFAFALLFGRSGKRWIMYVALIAALCNTWFLGFILGMALADIYVNKQQLISKLKRPVLYCLLIIGVVLGGFPTASIEGTFYQYIKLPWFEQEQMLYTTIGALFIVLSILSIRNIKSIMSSKIMSQLGKYTYSFYLVHQPIIYTMGTGLFVIFINYMGYNKSVALSIACTTPLIATATLIFYKYIEAPSMAIASYFEEIYAGKREFSYKEKYVQLQTSISARIILLKGRRDSERMPEAEID